MIMTVGAELSHFRQRIWLISRLVSVTPICCGFLVQTK